MREIVVGLHGLPRLHRDQFDPILLEQAHGLRRDLEEPGEAGAYDENQRGLGERGFEVLGMDAVALPPAPLPNLGRQHNKVVMVEDAVRFDPSEVVARQTHRHHLRPDGNKRDGPGTARVHLPPIMGTQPRSIRVAAKAIVIRKGELLVTVNRDPDGLFYLLPGGGQERGETLPETLRRECREEIGADVEVGELLFVREYIGAHHEFAEHDGDAHQIELMFRCELPDGEGGGEGTEPDLWQTGIAWIPIAELARYRLYPAALAEPLRRVNQGTPAGPAYLGDVN